MAITQIPWTTNFGRTYKITFGTREVEYSSVTSPETVVAPLTVESTRVTTDAMPSDAVSIDNLVDPRGFTFNFESQQVASSNGADSERSNLTLYNLDEESERVLLQPNCVVQVEAGYEGQLTLCYTGDVVSVTPQHNPPETSYKIQLSAAGNAVRNQMINTHYDESISQQDIIKDMALRFSGTSLATYGLNDLSDKYKTGGTGATGSLITNFDAHMQAKGLEYTFSNNKMYIIPYRIKGADWDTFSRTNYTLDADSIKNISDSSDNTKKSDTDTQSKIKKYQINTYYLPVEVGQIVTVPTTEYLKEYAGTYIVKGRRVILQSKGNAWDVVLEVEQIAN